MRLHKLKASDTTGTYLVESPVTEKRHPADGQATGQSAPAQGPSTDLA